jgi:hypothetical protein
LYLNNARMSNYRLASSMLRYTLYVTPTITIYTYFYTPCRHLTQNNATGWTTGVRFSGFFSFRPLPDWLWNPSILISNR